MSNWHWPPYKDGETGKRGGAGGSASFSESPGLQPPRPTAAVRVWWGGGPLLLGRVVLSELMVVGTAITCQNCVLGSVLLSQAKPSPTCSPGQLLKASAVFVF